MREKIAIVDCGTGNLASVSNAFRKLGAEAKIVSTAREIGNADKIVLPGVGSFGYFMEQLRANNLEKPLKQAISKKKPYLGICLGMQILFEESEESPGNTGLGVFKGKAVKFGKGKVPQVGWNYVAPKKDNVLNDGYAYFTNSYYCRPENASYIAGESNYFGTFACAVRKENVFAVQFHPERSGKYGLELLRRWLEC
ncbi:MAG: imidazole glycerol phosphate synthase subunit HisH [archaeon]